MNYWFSESNFLKVLFAFAGGLIAGLYGSSVGSGALVSFPTMLLVGLPTHSTIATNIFGAAVSEITAAIRYHREISVNTRLGIGLGMLAAVGSFVGANLVMNIDIRFLNAFVAFALVATFIILLLKKKLGLKEHINNNHRSTFLILGTALLGVYGGFFGAGFGTFILMLLVTTGYSFTNGAALSRVIGSIMSVVAAMTFAFHGVINYPYGIALGIGYGLGGWFGAGISIKKGDKYIRALLLLVIVLSAVNLVIG